MQSLTTLHAPMQNCTVEAVPHWALGPFVKRDDVNPIISPRASVFNCPMRRAPVKWERAFVFNPAAAVHNGDVVLLYRAEDGLGDKLGGHTSRLGIAIGEDGLHFRREDTPVLFPDNDDQVPFDWPGGCEDPRLVEREDGKFVVLYTAWNHETPRLCAAVSTDLRKWVKHGPVLADAYSGRFVDLWTKAGAIVARLIGDRLVAVKIDGKYWMYFGEGDVYAATSDDLIKWTPLLDSDSNLRIIFSVRAGMFDSTLCEPGPPAVLTDQGIVLLYNGRNDEATGDPTIQAGTYCAAQALFDASDPARLIARTDVPFFRPERAYETTGQYVCGTVFIEGLVYFEGRWFLYYGAADSHVAVAVWDPASSSSDNRFEAGLLENCK